MLRLDVITDIGIFVLLIDSEFEGDSDTATFYNAVKAVKACAEFEGWTPYQSPSQDPPNMVSVEPGAAMKGFRMYDDAQVGTKTANADAAQLLNKVCDFAFDGEYLGNVLHISGLGYRTASTEYLLPLSVGDKHACESMKGAALAQQVQLWKEAQGVPSTDYTVIIPDVPMKKSDARDYLIDYADEAEPQTSVHGDGKAKAWPGWNET